MDIHAWLSMHGYLCMDRHAWISMHGCLFLDIHAWISMHGYPCIDIDAWRTLYWKLSTGYLVPGCVENFQRLPDFFETLKFIAKTCQGPAQNMLGSSLNHPQSISKPSRSRPKSTYDDGFSHINLSWVLSDQVSTS